MPKKSKPAYKKKGWISPRHFRRVGCDICGQAVPADMLSDGLCLHCEDAQQPSNFNAAWDWAEKVSKKLSGKAQ